jgi:trans-2-enoyl-CoA reductase
MTKEERLKTFHKLFLFKETVIHHDVVFSGKNFPSVTVWLPCLAVYLSCVFVSMEAMDLRQDCLINMHILHKFMVYTNFALIDAPFLRVFW